MATVLSNMQKWCPADNDTEGFYQIPKIKGESELRPVETWMRFSDAVTRKPKEGTGVHFFERDAEFERIWSRPDAYIPLLGRVSVVASPDFSLYTDMPVAMQIYNHYRKHWIGSYLQEHGITVIPTIAWSTKESLAWCFDGEPSGSIVAVSSKGTQRQGKEARALFLYGFDAMLERMNPSMILMDGSIPQGLKGNIIRLPAVYDYAKNKRSQRRSEEEGS